MKTFDKIVLPLFCSTFSFVKSGFTAPNLWCARRRLEISFIADLFHAPLSDIQDSNIVEELGFSFSPGAICNLLIRRTRSVLWVAGYTISMLMWGDQEQVINAAEGRIIARVRLNSLIETFSRFFLPLPFFSSLRFQSSYCPNRFLIPRSTIICMVELRSFFHMQRVMWRIWILKKKYLLRVLKCYE